MNASLLLPRSARRPAHPPAPAALGIPYRSEAFAEDLEPASSPRPRRWQPGVSQPAVFAAAVAAVALVTGVVNVLFALPV